MPRAKSGHGIEDPVQIRALKLITPHQFGVLVGHGATTVEAWIRRGWIKRYTALPTSNVLIHIDEVDRFLAERSMAETTKREAVSRARQAGRRATA